VTTQSPTRKMGRNAQRRPRDSDASSILTDDEPSSLSTPYAKTPDRRPKNVNKGKGAAVMSKHNLQKQAMQNRRSISGAHTPRQVPLRDDDSVPSNLQVVGTSLTPASKKPIPILSNFEDWLKLATDNKINATNSWNFALIDYFHEMSLLKDEGGKSINFQKASCTLDGCVKIYSSRVESVGVEAGRLLSGLATSATDEDGKKKKRRGEDGEEEEGSDVEGDESDGEGGKKKKEKKRKQRSHEATLAPSFASLQLKKLEVEFAVDPLFKKASADFDEGGAKGLLLNHLCINEDGRIVFDSSDDAGEAKPEAKEQGDDTLEREHEQVEGDEQSETEDHASQSQHQSQQQQYEAEDVEIDLTTLANKFFPDLSLLDQLDICPSMKNFKLGDPTAALSIPLLNADNNDWKSKNPSPEKSAPLPPQIDGELNFADQSGFFLDGSHGLDFDHDDDDAIGLGGFDMNMDDQEVGFGQGGEAWAREAAVEPMPRPVNAADDDEQQGDSDGYDLNMEIRSGEDIVQEEMLVFFGKAVNSRAKVGSKAFQTLTNWRIAKIQQAAAAENAPPQRTRKEKEPFKIDFHGPMSENLRKLLAERPVSNDKISLPRTQLKTKGRNLLDKDDELIDVKSMMRLWTKPKCRVSRNRRVIDEGFGARGRAEAPRIGLDDKQDEDEEDAPQGDYDANFFADDEPLGLPFDGPLPIDDDDDEEEGGEQPGFVDAREMLSPPPDGVPATQNINDVLEGSQEPLGSQQPTASQAEVNMLPGSFGSQLVTQQGKRLRPEYVNYARTAKKVDVRALKENMWKGMIPRLSVFSAPEERGPTPPLTDADGDSEMMEADAPATPTAEEQPQQRLDGNAEEVLKFTDILGGLRNVYPDNQMKDISTSYGFICLLHLANEKGLVLEGGREEGTMEEILVRRDGAVGEGYVGE